MKEQFHHKMEEIDRKKAALEQVQTFHVQLFAHKLALMDTKEKRDVKA
jgi:hypothetical protein